MVCYILYNVDRIVQNKKITFLHEGNTRKKDYFIENNDFHFISITKHNLLVFLFLNKTSHREENHDIQTLTLR